MSTETYYFNLGKYSSVYDLPPNRAKYFFQQVAVMLWQKKQVAQRYNSALKHTLFWEDADSLDEADQEVVCSELKDCDNDHNDYWVRSIIKQRKALIKEAGNKAYSEAVNTMDRYREGLNREMCDIAMENSRAVDAQREREAVYKRYRFAKARKIVLAEIKKIRQQEKRDRDIEAAERKWEEENKKK